MPSFRLLLLATLFGLSDLASAASSIPPEIKVLRTEFDKKAEAASVAAERWYIDALGKLERSALAKQDVDTAALARKAGKETWLKNPLGRPDPVSPVAKPSPAEVEIEKIRKDFLGRRAQAVDPVIRTYRSALVDMQRRASRAADTEGLVAAENALHAIMPLQPTGAELSEWLVGSTWRWWKTETIDFIANGKGTLTIRGAKIPFSWRIKDSQSLILQIQGGPHTVFLQDNHMLVFRPDGYSWKVERLTL